MPPSITDNPEAFFEELNKPQKEETAVEVSPATAPVAPQVGNPLTGNIEPAQEQPKPQQISVADDPEAFFADLTKPVETKKETPESVVLSQLAGKTGAEINDFDIESLNLLSPKELEDVTNTRKDIPLTENLLRTKFDYEMSLPWNEGVNTLEDWKKIGQEVFGGGVSFLKGAQKFAEQSLFSEADQDPSGWGHPSFKPIKDYASGITALPESAAYLFTKLKEGGIGLKDRLSESLGIQDREKSYENYKARNLVDRIQTQAMQENPSIYSRILKGDMANDALAYVVLNTLPDRETLMAQEGLTAEQADSKRKEIANAIARQTTTEIAGREKPADEDIATFATFTAPAGLGLGEMGLVSLGVEAGMGLTPKLIQGAKYLGKTDQEIKAMNDAAQALQKETALKGLEQAQKPSMLGRAAGALATGIEKAEAAATRIGEATPKILKELAPPVAGAVIAGGDHRGEGAVVGALLGNAGKPALAALKYAAKTPALVRDIEEARVLAAGGSKGTFETLASFPEVSENAAKILRFGGRRLDNTLNNVVEYAKAGVNPTLIALATGALESASPEELNKLTSTGLLYGLGGRVVHQAWGKITGVDPVIDARNRRQQDIDDLKTYRDLDPETRKTLDSVTSWDNIIERHTQRAANAEQAYNDAVALGKKDAENLGKVAQAEKNILSAVTRANVQTRDEFSRQFVTQLTKLNQLVNGTLRAGQNNVGINILTPEQIVAKFRSDPANATATDQEILDVASQRGFYSTPEGAVEYQAGMGMDAPKKKIVFDRTKPSVVINADALKARMMIEGSTPIDALNHEAGHHVRNIPEFREANKDAERLLFSQEVRDLSGKIVDVTTGQYSEKALVEMYLDSYLKDKTPDEVTQLSQLAGLWDYSRGALNEKAVAEYMKDEIIAELNSETFSTHLGKGLDSGVLHMVDIARLKTKKNLLDRAVQKFFGLGGKGEATSDLTGARFSPEVLAANRQAMRALQSLQGEVSQAVTAVESPKISRAEMLRSKALMDRHGKYAGLFKTKMQAQVFDGNGNPIGTPIDITNPNASEGSWESRNGVTTQLNGYGARPDEVAEASGVVIPDGGRLVVQKQIVTQPDGVTPVMMTPKEAKDLQKARAQVIRESLNTPDEGAPNRFEAVADDSDTWRGTFTPLQIQAIKDMPEGIIPKSIKEHMLKINDMIVKGDGGRMLVDYAAVMNDAGKYTAYSPKIYDVVPIGMHLSKNGNFLVTTISVGRMFDKLNAWSERMPARLAPWGGSKDAFFKEFTEKYLQNWQNGVAGETGLSGDKAEALAKKDIFNDFLNLTTNDFRGLNTDRTKTPRRRGDARGKDVDRTIMSMRLDHMAELMDNDSAPKVPIDYGKAIKNFMPSEVTEPAPAQDERRPTPFDGITAAYNLQGRAFGARYVPAQLEGETKDDYVNRVMSARENPYTPDTSYTPLAGSQYDYMEGSSKSGANDIAFMPSEEEKENLTAVHNLSEENLRNVLKVGGLAVPSVAVIRNDRSDFTSFGEITLVAPYAMVDPKRDSKSKVFNADVYSPRYPRIDYSMPDKKANRNLIDSIKESINKIPEDIRKRFFVSLETDQADRPMRERFSEDPIFMAGFLADTNRIGDVKFGIPEEERYADQSARWNVREFMRENTDLKEEFNNWIENKLDEAGVTEEEKLFAGYTPSGTRRYVPHTLDNVVKMMAKSIRDGEGPNYGVGSVRSKAAKQFRTLEQVKNAREQIVSKDRMEELKAEVNDEFEQLAQESIKLRNVQRDFYFDNIADDMKALAEGGSENMNYLKEQYPNGAPFEKWRDYLEKLRNLPTEYFEAKIQRGVGLDEFAGAVVPKETSQDVIESLEKRGLEVIKYDERNEGSRAQAIRDIGAKRSDIAFMPSAGEERPVPTQEELDAMKARLPEYSAKTEKYSGKYGDVIKIYSPDRSREVGFAIIGKSTDRDNTIDVYETNVDLRYRGKGYGEALYREIAKYAQGKDADTLFGGSVTPEAQKVRSKLFETKPSTASGFGVESKVPSDIRFMPSSKVDEAYASAIESGDMEEAQRLVSDTAKKAGYTIGPVYHGTPTGGFNVFREQPTYFAGEKADADIYQSSTASSIRVTGTPDGTPETKKVFLKANNVFDTRKPKDRELFEKEFLGKSGEEWGSNGTPIGDRGLPDWTDGRDLVDWINEEGLPYDALALDEGGFPQSDGTVRVKGASVVVWKPHQIKSADPATYDNEGKLIPLSQRFDTSKPDIRFMPEGKEPKEKESLRLKMSKETLTDTALNQSSWKNWYKEHKETIDDFFGDHAKLFQDILGVTSQASSVKANVGLALKAFGQLMRGEDFAGYLPAVVKNLNAIRDNTNVSGRKISNYKAANEGEVERVVVDRHISRLLYGVDVPSKAQYDKAELILTEIANELGWEPSQVQAALWAHSIVQSGKIPQSYGDYLKKLESKGGVIQRIGGTTYAGGRTPESGGGRGRYSPTGEGKAGGEGIAFLPYSPELPKTEDGKVDWEGFKTRTMEIAKPLADLSPLGGVSFMPAKKPVVAQAGYDDKYLKKALKDGKDGKVKLTRPFKANEALPTMEQLPVIGNQVDRNTFKYNEPAEVIFYEHDGTPVSFKWDGQMLVKPEFKDIAEEHAGKAVQLAMADRQTATGGDMGGVMHTFLKSLRTITIKDPLTGNDLIVVWANNEWKPAKNMKDKVRMFGAKDLLTYLMGEDAHASNARSVRRISNEIDNSGLNDKEIDTFLILANKGVKTARKAEQNKTIKDASAAIEKAKANIKKEKSPEKKADLQKLIKLAEKSISDAKAKLPQYEVTPEEEAFSAIITAFKSSFTGLKRGNRSEANFKAKEKEFYDFLKTPSFTKLRKVIHGKHMIKLDDTFKGRKAAVQNLLGLTIKGFNIDHILSMTADFKGGRIHHIVSSVELSTNPELGAVYLGEDPEQAKFMSPLEKAAAAQIKADPNFVVHEAYAWGMLGPVNGNHFLNTNPRTPEEYFPAFRERYAATKEDADKADKITNASESNLVNTMRDQKSFALTLADKSKKSKK